MYFSFDSLVPSEYQTPFVKRIIGCISNSHEYVKPITDSSYADAENWR